MNEKIKALALKCNFTELDIEDLSPGFEKFAELIVQECIGQCQGIGNVCNAMYDGEEGRRFKAVADNCETMIKEHFGVK